jgi:hypothetical protein
MYFPTKVILILKLKLEGQKYSDMPATVIRVRQLSSPQN